MRPTVPRCLKRSPSGSRIGSSLRQRRESARRAGARPSCSTRRSGGGAASSASSAATSASDRPGAMSTGSEPDAARTVRRTDPWYGGEVHRRSGGRITGKLRGASRRLSHHRQRHRRAARGGGAQRRRRRPHPHESRAAKRATPDTRRAASRRRSAPTILPNCTSPTRWRPATACATKPPCASLVEDGPRYVRELMAWGVRFDRDADGEPALAIEGAHSARRVLHARDATGREIGRALWQRASALPGIIAQPHARVVDLTVEDGECRGACFLDASGVQREARAADRAAGDRRRGPGVSGDDEPRRRDRRRRRDGLSRRRGGRRSGVRAVPSDGAEGRRAAALPAVGGAARRRRAV